MVASDILEAIWLGVYHVLELTYLLGELNFWSLCVTSSIHNGAFYLWSVDIKQKNLEKDICKYHPKENWCLFDYL